MSADTANMVIMPVSSNFSEPADTMLSVMKPLTPASSPSTETAPSSPDEKGSQAPGVKKPTALDFVDVRFFDTAEYQCSGCGTWFPLRVVRNTSRGPLSIKPCLPHSLNYEYTCAACSHSGAHHYLEKAFTFLELCTTAIANLTAACEKRGTVERMFSRDREIIPFIDRYWDKMTSDPRRNKSTWRETVSKILNSTKILFRMEKDDDSTDMRYGLEITNLRQINPYDFVVFSGKSEKRPPPTATLEKSARPVKRQKSATAPTAPPQPKIDPLTALKAFPSSVPAEFPANNPPYRYILAECDRNSPLSTTYLNNPDEWHDQQGRQIPPHMYRVFVETRLALSAQERAPQLRVAQDGLTVTGDKGYSMVRGTHSLSYGRWYYEFKVLECPGNSAIRAGWGTVFSVLQAPLGYDRFGYSWRSRKGTKFHDSRGKHYSDGYAAGDVIGCHIEIPPPEKVADLLPDSCKSEPLVKYKNHLYYEVKDEVAKQVQQLRPVPGSQITFFKNGISQGVAYSDINAGHYFPCISLYKNCVVRANFGPTFDFPPKSLAFLPVSERVNEASVEQTVADCLYNICNTLDF